MIVIRILIHIFVFVSLTVLTQIGGFIYLLAIAFVKKTTEKHQKKRILLFGFLYLIATFLIVPFVAPLFGREKVKETPQIQAHSFMTKLLNRNYVKPELNTVLQKVATEFEKKQPQIKIIYLDANFPFIDKFPLLPHKSHNDGKKIDLSFIYQDNKGKITNKKPAVSGYGIFVEQKKHEVNQTKYCKAKGYWQYDFTKYMSLGKRHNNLFLSEKATRDLILEIVKLTNIGKVFVEPNLKTRMKLKSNKIRFHGCGAVRHDDHIHVQLR